MTSDVPLRALSEQQRRHAQAPNGP